MMSITKLTIPLTPILVLILSLRVIECTQDVYYYFVSPILIYFVVVGIRYLITDKVLLNILLIFLPFSVWALLTSLWSFYPLMTFLKASYHFAIMFCGVFAGLFWVKNNKSFLSYFLPLNILLLVICIYSLIENQPNDSWSGGNGMGFKGYVSHQNSLAFLIFVSSSYWIYKLVEFWSNGKERILSDKWHNKRNVVWSILFCNITILLTTFSRTTILSFSFLVILLTVIKFRRAAVKFYIAIFTIVLIGNLISPKAKAGIEWILYKGYDYNFQVRKALLVPSFEAVKNGSLLGLGYGVSDTKKNEAVIGLYLKPIPMISNNNTVFFRDKAYSTLALIEETGLIGMTLFYIPLFYLIFNSSKKIIQSSRENENTNYYLRYSFPLIFIGSLVLHAQFSAWWSGISSINMFMFYSILGATAFFYEYKK